MLTRLFAFICLVFFSSFTLAHSTKQAPLSIGHVTQLSFESELLKQTRQITIHLPASYDDSKQSYPTLYLLDGERHLAHSVLATRLYNELEMVPELIIVAIENLQQDGARSQDLSHQKQRFADFLEQELTPYIDETYRTSGDATLYGHSLAAYFAVDMLVNRPHVFDRYIAASPPLQGDEARYHQTLLNTERQSNKTLYITMTPEAAEGESVFNAYNNFIALMSAKKPENLSFRHALLADQNHISNYYITFFQGIAKVFEPKQSNPWDTAYNEETKQRFIPVELFTGAQWDGEHTLSLKEATTTACSSFSGQRCTEYHITGPFKTESNNTQIEWVGDQIPYYRRTFSTRRMGEVLSFFTINNSKDGLVRIYDKRKQWGERTYDGLGSKFPLGYWKQGEVRTYPSRRPTRIEIIELNGPDNCLTFRWVIGDGKRRNQDNQYTFCPNRGFTKMKHNYQEVD